jgi:RNA polymerase sigma factor for flagellar operon FliA
VTTQTKTAQEGYLEISQLDQEERDRLVTENLSQVHYIARRIHERIPEHVPFEDLVNAGIVGLLEAIRNYDPNRNVKLKTFAKMRIEGAILDSLRDLDWSPRELRKQGRQVEQAIQSLQASLGRAPSEPELAAEMGMELKSLQELLGDLGGLDVASLDGMAAENEREDHLYHYVPKSPDQDPLDLCLQSESRECLTQAVGELPERDRQVLALYYHEELTMKEVGAVLGVGEGRISQIHSAALLRLRARVQQLLSSHPAMRAGGANTDGMVPWIRS